MPTPRTRTNPRILLRSGRPLVIADATVRLGSGSLAGRTEKPVRLEAAPEQATEAKFRAIGYRQTLEPAARGGKANKNGFRFRNQGMRALARSFRGQPFISGHDWGDVRARGGTIADAYAEEIANDTEMAIFYDIVAQAAWAVEGLANGTIDRFSFGVFGKGEITCTIHNVPVWSIDECFCWPGEMVGGLVAEWEFEDGEGVELSAVNVPAVEGTSIVDAIDAGDRASEIRELAALCGRNHPRLEQLAPGGAPRGGFRRPQPALTMTPCPTPASARSSTMDPVLLRKQLGLPATATDEEVLARIQANATDAAQAGVLRTQLAEVASREQQLGLERDQAHVDAEITRLRATRQVGEPVIESLRTAAKASRASFDSSLALVEASAPAIAPGPGAARVTLQSDAKPAENPGGALIEFDAEGPDALELNKTNPHMPALMRTCRVTAADVRKHGARQFTTLPNLRELADNTASRGDRPGVGK